MDENFGEWLKRMRTEHNETQRELAASIGVASETTISRWENNLQKPNHNSKNQLANHYQIPIEKLNLLVFGKNRNELIINNPPQNTKIDECDLSVLNFNLFVCVIYYLLHKQSALITSQRIINAMNQKKENQLRCRLYIVSCIAIIGVVVLFRFGFFDTLRHCSVQAFCSFVCFSFLVVSINVRELYNLKNQKIKAKKTAIVFGILGLLFIIV